IAIAVDVADAADGSLNTASEATDTADGTLSPAADTADGSPHIAEDAPPFDMDAWDAQCATIKSGQDALRVAIRSVGASLAKISDAAASDVKRIEQMTEKNNELSNSVKSLIDMLGETEKIVETITDSLRIIGQYKENSHDIS
ncbi:MAG: hypothetical protein FWH01_11205, partial [Oscillospiraceae bacterium]|nr:hypothetical protein [Oscillospiraceae bacterium]